MPTLTSASIEDVLINSGPVNNDLCFNFEHACREDIYKTYHAVLLDTYIQYTLCSHINNNEYDKRDFRAKCICSKTDTLWRSESMVHCSTCITYITVSFVIPCCTSNGSTLILYQYTSKLWFTNMVLYFELVVAKLHNSMNYEVTNQLHALNHSHFNSCNN